MKKIKILTKDLNNPNSKNTKLPNTSLQLSADFLILFFSPLEKHVWDYKHNKVSSKKEFYRDTYDTHKGICVLWTSLFKLG